MAILVDTKEISTINKMCIASSYGFIKFKKQELENYYGPLPYKRFLDIYKINFLVVVFKTTSTPSNVETRHFLEQFCNCIWKSILRNGSTKFLEI